MPSSRRLEFSQQAAADVRSILRYTRATWGEGQRRTYSATLDTGFARLVQFPEIGKRRDELAPGLRSYAVGDHIILYRVTGDAIIIRRVVYSRRDAEGVSGF